MPQSNYAEETTSSTVIIQPPKDRTKVTRSFVPSRASAPFYRRQLARRLNIKRQEFNDIHFKFAMTLDERKQAFRLVHFSYVDCGIANPTPSGLLFSPFHILPGTTTFIAKRKGVVIGTVSLIEDSAIGLPMEVIYPAEVAQLRYSHQRIAEVGTLTVAKEVHGYGVLFMLYNALLQWARARRRIEDLAITVLPRAQDFYRNALLFESLGPSQKYHTLNDFFSTPLHLDLVTMPYRYCDAYNHSEMEIMFADQHTNLYKFFFDNVIDPVQFPFWTNSLYSLSSPPLWAVAEVASYMRTCQIELANLPAQVRRMIENFYPGLASSSGTDEIKEVSA